MATLNALKKQVKKALGKQQLGSVQAFDELTIEVGADNIKAALLALRDDSDCAFDQMIDLCGVDYSEVNQFSDGLWKNARYGVVYHLLSVKHNHRLRVKTYVDGEMPMVDSVIDVWAGANWFEREAFDMFGIVFKGHPDLRRLLTDYGFIGHPFRKDFPLSGHVEMRYDEDKGRVIYEPVTIEPRVLVPRTAGTDKV